MKKNWFYIMLSSCIALSACFSNNEKATIMAAVPVQLDTMQGSCPYLTKDNNGQLVISWIRQTDSSKAVYCYAVSTDGGKTFGNTIVIPGSENIHPHGENMPKIVFKPDGEIIAAWASANPNPRNAYSDLVYYSMSFDKGHTWTSARRLVADTAGYDQRYFDMGVTAYGEIAIVWLDNRKTTSKEGSAMYFAETSGRAGFENAHLVAQPCCPCCRTDLYIDSKKDVHVVYRAIINDSIRDMEHIVSTDNGKTFSAPERISDDNWVINGCPHTGPAMTENDKGIQFTWFTGGGNGGIYYCHSGDDGKTFSPRQMVSGISSKHCQIASLNDNKLAITWNETFFNKNVTSSRIGLEIRDARGGDPVKTYITSEGGEATFPVIKSIDQKTAVIAYTESAGNKNYVKYQRVTL